MSIFDHINKKVALIALAVFLVLAGGFIFFLATGKTDDTAVVTRIEASPLDATLGRELLSTLARLKATTIDTSIFDDPVFASLQDFGVTIASQPIGRRNPFAPFDTAAASSASAKSAPSKAVSVPLSGQTAGAAASKKLPPPPLEEEEEFSGFDVE